MLDIARGRVGGWMHAETRNNAWSAFRHWRRTCVDHVPEMAWRMLGIEWAHLCLEDFDGEFGTHVLQDEQLWNNLMTDSIGEGSMFWGESAALPAWRVSGHSDVYWTLP
jgi:hypothetical protein